MAVPQVKLNNGVTIPAIGAGAWAPDEEPRSQVKGWLLSALKAGYRHIDTAEMYGTEEAVGQAIKESGIPREEIYITTKLAWTQQGRVAEALEGSLKRLGVDYVDLYLLHWPQAMVYEEGTYLPKNPDGSFKMTDDVNFKQAWAQMEKLLQPTNGGKPKVRAIGVSNFSIKTLEELLSTAKVVPAVNQVELHPYLVQQDLYDYCKRKGIVLTAYSPSGYANVRSYPLIVELAAKYKVKPNQITLAWHLARGHMILPKSVNKERQKENISLPTLEPADVDRITGLDRGQRLCNYPKDGLVWGWTAEQLGW